MLNFLCIGAQKCGTSWLHEILSDHPKLSFPGGKELHFWNGAGNLDVEKYLGLFGSEEHVHGDMTPAYAFLSPDRIGTIHAVLPHLRLIYLIRDPRDRAWSSARMALQRAELAPDEGSDQWFIDHFTSRGSLARGDYETCIRNWSRIFSPDQLLVLRYELIQRDPVGLANQVLQHLGLEPFFTDNHLPSLKRRVFEGDGIHLPPRLRAFLGELYAARITSLENYMKIDLSDWKKPVVPA